MELRLPEAATPEQYQELGGFVRYCVERIERDTGRADSWMVRIGADQVCYHADVAVDRSGVVVTASGDGFDPVVAGGEAFRRVETLLQFQRERLAEVTDGRR